MTEWTHIEGRKKRDLKLYALSTCGHCKRTKEFLDNSKVAYDYIYVDLLDERGLEKVYDEMKKFNPRGSFPTLVFDGKDVIVGSRIDEIKKALGIND
ncbi:glutaredoxin [Methanomicrobium sp. W14]|uniref:glutaredoxin family protein n=1 Tax=Methanomicrobium sp. W14 TaxID=2817839 RepID=UPI001AE6A666|nr:glutaredoxin family protein [Methanomicrobium sp. W14]MBP2132637.1 glutaredoxin [Methanomicrobium sp. W14]